MNLLDSISFISLRCFALITHFVLTPMLIWTRFDSITVSLKPKYSRADYDETEEVYLGLLGFGITVLVFKLLFFSMSYHHITIGSIMHFFMDVLGSFFVAWIVLDALDWRNYIYVLVFCVLLPATCDCIKYYLFLQKNMWISWRAARSTTEYFLQVYLYTRAGVIFGWRSFIELFNGSSRTPTPAPQSVEEVSSAAAAAQVDSNEDAAVEEPLLGAQSADEDDSPRDEQDSASDDPHDLDLSADSGDQD